MFEVSFRDDRYLHFEGAGVIPRWRIDLPKDTNSFDFETLSDVVLRISYTAREGGKPLADAARKSLQNRRSAGLDSGDGDTPATALRRLFRVRYEFADAWTAFRNTLSSGEGTLSLAIDQERFPYLFKGKKIPVVEFRALLQLDDADRDPWPATVVLDVSPPKTSSSPLTFAQPQKGATFAEARWTGEGEPGKWSLAAKAITFPAARVKDIMILLTYTAS